MASDENHLEVGPEDRKLVAFRDDLRLPEVEFGHCKITGEWGKVVSVDMGDIAFECPNIEDGVEYDPDTKQVTFTKWKPAVFASQATFSADGLRQLLTWMEDQESPIPTIKPILLYKWQVLYSDGDALSQFIVDDDGNEQEINSREIQWDKGINQISVLPRFDLELPTFTYVAATAQFYRNGELLDVDYDGAMHEQAKIVYARKVTHTFGSVVGQKLARRLDSAHTTVLQLLGWHVDGVEGLEVSNTGACCVIAIDDRGNWRPWKQQLGVD